MTIEKYTYFAYGLGIQSDLPLPELQAWDGPCQVAIRLEDKNGTSAGVLDRRGWLKLGREEAVLSLPEIGLFTLSSGREVDLVPAPGTRQSLLQLALLGPVISGLLFQRGDLVLHASSVEIDGGAVAFLGGSGYGKSAMAAALAVRGHAIVSDDVTPVAQEQGEAGIFPGFPRLKISLEVAAVLGIDGASLVLLDPQISERGWVGNCWRSPGLLPLQRVYVLDGGDQPEIVPLTPREAVIELLRHSYPTCTQLPGDALHFQQCALLAGQVASLRLSRTDELNSLSMLADLVEADVARGSRRVYS